MLPTVAGVHFYRGAGGDSGYTQLIFAKKNNASSLEEVVQFGTNDALTTTFAGDVTSTGLTVDYTGNRTGDAGILVTNDHSDWGIKVDKDPSGDDYGILSQTDGA